MTYPAARWITPFILAAPLALAACVVPQSQYDALKTQNQQLEQQVASQQAEIQRLHGAITYTVNSDLLFPSGSWELSDRGKQVIARLAQKLAPQQNHIYISGYTDNVPIGAGLKAQGVTSNVALSQKRADAVKDFIVSQGGKPELLTAHGYGEADPVASNATAQGRGQNRRVVLSLSPPAA